METTIIYCDRCNLGHETQRFRIVKLTDEEVAARYIAGTVLEVKVSQLAGVFFGSFAEASADGWQERDYGHCCPPCAQEEAEVEASGDVVVGLDELGEALVSGAEPKG